MTQTQTITRLTFTLDCPAEQTAPTGVLVVRESDGEIRLTRFSDHRSAEQAEELVAVYGGTVLMRIEGECNLETGESSAYMTH